MPVNRSGRRFSHQRLRATLERLLDASTLCAIATVSHGRAYINTAYFAWTPDFRLVWLSEPHSRHSLNLAEAPTAAVAVYDSTQVWGDPDRGSQLFGSAREVAGKAAERARETYAQRFERSAALELSAYHPYVFRPQRVKLFDETRLGGGIFVTARVSRGTLAWERTEVYSAKE